MSILIEGPSIFGHPDFEANKTTAEEEKLFFELDALFHQPDFDLRTLHQLLLKLRATFLTRDIHGELSNSEVLRLSPAQARFVDVGRFSRRYHVSEQARVYHASTNPDFALYLSFWKQDNRAISFLYLGKRGKLGGPDFMFGENCPLTQPALKYPAIGEQDGPSFIPGISELDDQGELKDLEWDNRYLEIFGELRDKRSTKRSLEAFRRTFPHALVIEGVVKAYTMGGNSSDVGQNSGYPIFTVRQPTGRCRIESLQGYDWTFHMVTDELIDARILLIKDNLYTDRAAVFTYHPFTPSAGVYAD